MHDTAAVSKPAQAAVGKTACAAYSSGAWQVSLQSTCLRFMLTGSLAILWPYRLDLDLKDSPPIKLSLVQLQLEALPGEVLADIFEAAQADKMLHAQPPAPAWVCHPQSLACMVLQGTWEELQSLQYIASRACQDA